MKKILFYFMTALIFVQCHTTKKTVDKTATVKEKIPTVVDVEEKPDKDYIPTDPDVRIGKLPNGMTYYIRRNKKPEKKMELRLAVKVGSVVEDDDQQGLAHFMEHMNFNGLKHFPKNELVEFLEKMGVRFGADLNAFTSFDETVYILPIPLDKPENLDKGLLVIHDWAYFANLSDDEIDKERGVVLEEYRLGLGPEQRMRKKTIPVLLKGSRYAERLPIGKKKILETFPHDVLRRFHRDWYRPDLEAVVVVGDIDPDQVEAKIKKMFADIPPAKNPRKRTFYKVPNHPETLIATASDPEAGFNSVRITYKDRNDYVKPETVNDYVDYLKTSLFSKMLNNRLDDIKESDNPPFTFAGVYHGLLVGVTKEAFNAYAYTSPGKLKTALETLLREAKKVKEFGFTQAELDRAKKEMMADIEQAYNNRNTTESSEYAWQYVWNFVEGEPIPSVKWEYDMYKFYLPKISLGEVNALAKKYIHKDNRVISITGKGPADKPLLSKEEIRQIIDKVDREKVQQTMTTEVTKTLMKQKPAPGKITKIVSDKKLGTVTYYLDNGAVVTAKKTGFKKDEVQIMSYKMGGKSLLSDDELQKTAFAFRGIAESAGVNGYKKSEIRKILAGKKISVNPFVDGTSEGLSGEARPADLETWFQWQYLIFTSLNKDQKAFESWKKRTAAFMGNLANMPQYKFLIAFNKYMHPNDPRYVPMVPTKEALNKIDYDLAYRKFREFFDGGTGFHYYIVGNFDENKLPEYIKTYIGGLPKSKTPDKFIERPDHTRKEHNEFVYHAGKDPKSMVIYQAYGPAKYNSEEKMYLKAAGEILSNKLIKRIRENESGVYTVRAMGGLDKYPHEKFRLSIVFPCGPKNARRLAGHAMEELNKLIDEGPSAEDLQKIQKSWTVKFDEDIKTNSFWTDYLSDTDYLGADKYRLFHYKDKVNAMTPAKVKEILVKYVKNPANSIMGIWYPEGFNDQK